MAEGAKLERRTLGEDRDHRFTKIVVNLGDAPDDPDDVTLLGDDTTGEDQKLIEGGPLGSLALKKKPN
jgi:hypothetical protein